MLSAAIFFLALSCQTYEAALVPNFRPPSVPLITSDPYMNIWSFSENSTVDCPMYWDKTTKEMAGYIRIDAETYRFMGCNSYEPLQESMTQLGFPYVYPTHTLYKFQDLRQRVQLNLRFFNAFLPGQWDIASRPVTYIQLEVLSIDQLQHSIQLYYDISAEIAVDEYDQQVTWDRFEISNSEVFSSVLKMGTVVQDYLGKSGDDIGIDWGYAYLAVLEEDSASNVITGASRARNQFIEDGTIPEDDDANKPRRVDDDLPVMAVEWDFLQSVSENNSKFLTFAYDDYYSIDYFGYQFQPYWRRPAVHPSIETLLLNAIIEYESVTSSCTSFDDDHVADLATAGGDQYSTLASLAYRQTMTATKLVWNTKLQMPWAFLKDISNGGHISRVDVIASAFPFFLYNDPALLELLILPILSYANNETGSSIYNYSSPWAPSSLGTYPIANITPVEQEDMPMEQTANIFIMLAAITNKLGTATRELWYPHYWDLLQTWADYLVETLPDPETQASPDDLGEPQEHNANLAIKGIVGLGAFAQLCEAFGKQSDSSYYMDRAVGFAAQWVTLAGDDIGGHYRRQFNLNGTWSQKYNLVYERILGISIFSPDIVPNELFYYFNVTLNPYGIPLDDRRNDTKLDTTALLAAMTTDTNYQSQIFSFLFNWANTTLPMTPLTDWYNSVNGELIDYTARPVVGALYGLMTDGLMISAKADVARVRAQMYK